MICLTMGALPWTYGRNHGVFSAADRKEKNAAKYVNEVGIGDALNVLRESVNSLL